MAALRTGQKYSIAPDVELDAGDSSTDEETVIGDDATIRSGSIIYRGVTIGDRFTTGHNVLVRSETTIGNDVLVGTNSVVDGDVSIGSNVSLQTGTYLPQQTVVEDNVFFGPHAVVTNDLYPIREGSTLQETTIGEHVSLGANATILPGVTIERGSFVAAGALVTDDVPEETLAVGVPAQHRPLPERLSGRNHIP